MNTIRQVTPQDVVAYRAIRLEALQVNPEAFSSTYADESRQAFAWFSDRIARSSIYAAFDGDRIIATGGSYIPHIDDAGSRRVWGVYVTPSERGKGIARELMQVIMNDAQNLMATRLDLHVAIGNETAHMLYASLGFHETGQENGQRVMIKRLENNRRANFA